MCVFSFMFSPYLNLLNEVIDMVHLRCLCEHLVLIKKSSNLPCYFCIITTTPRAGFEYILRYTGYHKLLCPSHTLSLSLILSISVALLSLTHLTLFLYHSFPISFYHCIFHFYLYHFKVLTSYLCLSRSVLFSIQV